MTRVTRRRSMVAALIAAALAAATFTVATPSAVAATDAITNASFESGLTGWSVSGTSSASSVASGGAAGSYRLNHYLAASGSVTTYQAVTVSSTGWWTFDAQVRSGGGLGASRLTVAGCASEYRTVPDTSNGNGWVHIAVSFNATSSTCYLGLYTTGSAGAWAHMDGATLTKKKLSRSIRGGDFSGVAKNEAKGGKYYTSTGSQIDPYTAFGAAGANLARFKVWVNPADGYNTVSQVVASAKRAQAAGMKIMVDFHYSDTWADPGAQGVPSAWSGQSVSQLTTSVANHTTSVLTSLKNAGVTVDYVQVGNEINSGILWPYGQTWDVNTSDTYSTAQWSSFTGFLKAGSNAAKAVFPSTKVILHFTNISSTPTSLSWLLGPITSAAVPYDIIGLSYYGYWHGSLSDLQTTITSLSATYGKDVMVVETAYPFTLSDDTPAFTNVISTSSQLVSGYAASTAAQAAWVRAVQDVVAAAPGGRGLGVVYWEPAWTAVSGSGWDPANSAAGNAWENQAMFDFNSRQIPASFATFGKDSSD